jgi:hypothetical protein
VPQREVAQPGTTVFGGEDGMHENPGQRLRHAGQNGRGGAVMQPLTGLGLFGSAPG